jgi:mRNA interferase MazF
LRPARGPIWRVQLATKVRAVLIIESDAALDAFADTALCMMIDETGGAPDTVVTVPLSAPVTGAAVALDVTALTTRRITAGTFLGTVDDAFMTRVATALRVVLELHD